MEIQQIAKKLERSCKKIRHEAQFSKYTQEELLSAIGDLTLSEELYQWYEISSPNDVNIRWTTNELILFNPLTLRDNQLGYRWNSISMERVSEWQESWLTIASIGGDPVIAHVDQKDTPISMDYHGMGIWKPLLVSDNLVNFLDFLSEWCDLINEYNGIHTMFDDDSMLLPDVLRKLETITKKTVGDTLYKNLMKFLWG
jgi:hypothetical protein